MMNWIEYPVAVLFCRWQRWLYGLCGASEVPCFLSLSEHNAEQQAAQGLCDFSAEPGNPVSRQEPPAASAALFPKWVQIVAFPWLTSSAIFFHCLNSI